VRPPRVQFTLRRLMIAIAVVGFRSALYMSQPSRTKQKRRSLLLAILAAALLLWLLTGMFEVKEDWRPIGEIDHFENTQDHEVTGRLYFYVVNSQHVLMTWKRVAKASPQHTWLE
jgi:hypothetical protein